MALPPPFHVYRRDLPMASIQLATSVGRECPDPARTNHLARRVLFPPCSDHRRPRRSSVEPTPSLSPPPSEPSWWRSRTSPRSPRHAVEPRRHPRLCSTQPCSTVRAHTATHTSTDLHGIESGHTGSEVSLTPGPHLSAGRQRRCPVGPIWQWE
ncbi:hypothetical protein PVAP13_1KG256415 [Panicum virgatum]|uniref:Uncharacterized protein n=1 Tax=Panicum virgatum TaxID=38727 RepID=A0A8T0XKH5_PANVG|nr:hypothetical protein PVAP13_1KG256415 [Panicum virgatum]